MFFCVQTLENRGQLCRSGCSGICPKLG